MTAAVDVERLRAWLGTTDVVLGERPGGGGWSNETWFVTVAGRPAVLRLSPAGRSMFPTYDLGRQVRCLELTRAAGLPVPEVLAADPGGDALGRPAFLMERLAGRVPADDDPPFTKAGFLFEASVEAQRAFCRAALDAIVAVHAVAPPPSLPTGPAPADHLAACDELLAWSGATHPMLLAASAALAADLPPPHGVDGLLWGDARPANMVVADDLSIVGLLDWELAAVGTGEFDIAWFLEMNRMRAEGMGIAPLPGFLSPEATWAHWADRVGRAPGHVEWHHRLAAYRVAILFSLFLRTMVDAGRLRPDHRLFTDNPGTRRLAELLS